MPRLIDANMLREEILTEDYDNDTINNFLDLVDLSPTIDAEPVIHGRWIERNDGTELQPMCDCCGYSYIEADSDCNERNNYCPRCGAKMCEENQKINEIKKEMNRLKAKGSRILDEIAVPDDKMNPYIRDNLDLVMQSFDDGIKKYNQLAKKLELMFT